MQPFAGSQLFEACYSVLWCASMPSGLDGDEARHVRCWQLGSRLRASNRALLLVFIFYRSLAPPYPYFHHQPVLNPSTILSTPHFLSRSLRFASRSLPLAIAFSSAVFFAFSFAAATSFNDRMCRRITSFSAFFVDSVAGLLVVAPSGTSRASVNFSFASTAPAGGGGGKRGGIGRTFQGGGDGGGGGGGGGGAGGGALFHEG